MTHISFTEFSLDRFKDCDLRRAPELEKIMRQIARARTETIPPFLQMHISLCDKKQSRFYGLLGDRSHPRPSQADSVFRNFPSLPLPDRFLRSLAKEIILKAQWQSDISLEMKARPQNSKLAAHRESGIEGVSFHLLKSRFQIFK